MQQFYQMIAVEYFSLSVTIWVTAIWDLYLIFRDFVCFMLRYLALCQQTCFFPEETRWEVQNLSPQLENCCTMRAPLIMC